MKRNPGHCEFVDQTAGAGPVDYTIEKEGTVCHTFYCTPAGAAASPSIPSRCFADSSFADAMDLDPELRKAIAAATGKDIESIEKAAAAKGGGLSRCACLHLTLGLPPTGVAGAPSKSQIVAINVNITNLAIKVIKLINVKVVTLKGLT